MEKEEGQDQRASDTATATSPDKKDNTTEEPNNPKKQFQKIKQEEITKFDRDLKKFKIPILLLERLKKEFDDSHFLSNEIGKSVILPSFK